jgi:hypothetical protein
MPRRRSSHADVRDVISFYFPCKSGIKPYRRDVTDPSQQALGALRKNLWEKKT